MKSYTRSSVFSSLRYNLRPTNAYIEIERPRRRVYEIDTLPRSVDCSWKQTNHWMVESRNLEVL